METPTGRPGPARSALAMVRDTEYYPAVILTAWFGWLYQLLSISPEGFVRPLALIVGGGLVLCVGARALLRDRHLAGLAALVVVILIASGHDPRIAAVGVVALALLVVVAIAVAVGRSGRRSASLARMTRIAQAGALILAMAVGIGAVGIPVGTALAAQSWPVPASVTSRPDIYLLLLDGHPRLDEQAEVLGVGDKSLEGSLVAHGFAIAPGSRSNYPQTGLTLSSMFSARHLDEVPAFASAASTDETTDEMAIETLGTTTAVRFFDDIGYDTAYIYPGYGPSSLRSTARVIDSGNITESEIALISMSGLRTVFQAVGLDAIAGQLRDRVEANLDLFVDQIAGPDDPPRFVLGHVPAPHGPLVFADDGKAALESLYRIYVDRPEGWSEDRFLAAYRQQVRKVDGLVAEAIEAAVSRTVRPSIFIVFSDHGYRRNGAIGSAVLDPTGMDVEEQYRNLFAWRSDVALPFGDQPSLVNVFPILLRSVLGVEIPCQAGRMFFVDPRAGIAEVRDPDDGSLGPGTLPDEPGCRSQT